MLNDAEEFKLKKDIINSFFSHDRKNEKALSKGFQILSLVTISIKKARCLRNKCFYISIHLLWGCVTSEFFFYSIILK